MIQRIGPDTLSGEEFGLEKIGRVGSEVGLGKEFGLETESISGQEIVGEFFVLEGEIVLFEGLETVDRAFVEDCVVQDSGELAVVLIA
jgi:hypothetical protein